MKPIAVIGAGAAGCFAAACLREWRPDADLTLYEAGKRPLAKVAVTGGGRCNLTNSFRDIDALEEAYPRGHRAMRHLLRQFSQEDAVAWFREHGLPLVLQDDGCWFPRSQKATDVVDTLLRTLRPFPICTGKRLVSLSPVSEGFSLAFADGTSVQAGRVLVTTGGARSLPFLAPLGLETVPAVPSLFPFNVPDEGLRALTGLVVDADLSLKGTRLRSHGPLLLTDWGMSGPATLRLSSYAARVLADAGYRGTLGVNWLRKDQQQTRVLLESLAASSSRRLVANARPETLPARLWAHLVQKAGIPAKRTWGELGSKGLNRLCALLTDDTYPLEGRSPYRDEFVTCGGVSLQEVNPNTLESKKFPGLFLAGEVLDIDAVTGGFNLQAAWSSGFAVASALAHRT